MAHYATKRYNYWGQLGILAAFCGAGLIIGGILSLVPLIGKMDIFKSGGNSSKIMEAILKPENANAVRMMQFITTLFLFFLPPVLYAKVCHVKVNKHLGFNNQLNIAQIGIVILVMAACSPLVDSLQQATEMLPWSKSTMLKFQQAEDDYFKQVMVIARMDNVLDYILSVIVIALLPAIFEETLFRGGLQNLLSRWFKAPIVAIVVTSIIFSAIHGSYLGFFSRFALGFLLGWFYYRTGNIWLNIIAHFFNNAAAVTVLYFSSKPGVKIDPAKMDTHYPLWAGLVSIAIIAGLFILFEKVSRQYIDRPGEEVIMHGYNISNNPFENDIANIGQNN